MLAEARTEEGHRLVRIASTRDVPDRQGLEVHVEGHRLGIFRVKDEYCAISNLCVHRGGPLSEGELDGYMVTCPWHGWKYDVRTGAFEIIPTLKIRSFKVQRKGDDLYIQLDH